jgi:hypothetical protein
MGKNGGSKPGAREIFVGIVVAVVSAIIISWLGLQDNWKQRDIEPVVHTVPHEARPVELVNLSGTWREPGGNIVLITQNGSHLTLRMPYLEEMGIPATQTGTLEGSPDHRYLAKVNVSNNSMRTELYVSLDGNRLEGRTSNAFSTLPVELFRN